MLLNYMMFASLYRLLREQTEEAEALMEKEAAEEAERQRVRASIVGRLKRPVSPLAELALPAWRHMTGVCPLRYHSLRSDA